ncbi:MAG TPA: DUF4349 domain-containing protein [Methanoregulaceae archaeon]|nr:DUF4349 domain-containing protein [Methanoregulaceae archaeon]
MTHKILALLIVCIAIVVISGCTGIPGGLTKSTVSQEGGSAAGSGGLQPAIGTNIGHSVVAPSGGGGGGGSYSGETSLDRSGVTPNPIPTIPPQTGGLPGQGVDTKIIKTAQVTLEVKNVTDAVETIKAICTQRGGYLSTTTIGKNYNDQATGTVILRIPADQFDSALSGVKTIGTVKSISTQGQDVTEEYVDVQAQISSYENQISQYNLIMKNATNVKDIINIQQQIDQVQTSLDRLNGRMKYLNSQIDYSTITVTLQEPEPVGGQTGHNFVAAINEGINGFFSVIDVIIVFFLSIIPLIIIGLVAYGGYRVWKRRYR